MTLNLSKRDIVQLWAHGDWRFEPDAPIVMVADLNRFATTLINHLSYATDAMPTPKWLDKLKSEVAAKLPSSLPEGRTEFIASTMTEPMLSGKFKKYAFSCATRTGQVINLSVSPTLLGRILEVVESGANFAITKQGSGINTNYVVEALSK
jgi:hypothetical protein